MFPQRKKLTSAYYCLLNAIPYIVLLIILASCGLPGVGDGSQLPNTSPAPSPIVASPTPARVLQACFDTFPLVPDNLFHAATNLVADVLSSSVNVNEGKISVYVSYITSHSYLRDAFSFTVPALLADPPEPVLPPTPSAKQVNGSSFDVANAQATAQAIDDGILSGWYAKLNTNHALLAAARATMEKYTSRLRSLPNINDPTGEDIGGCLLTASNRMAGFVGRKTIILSSPLYEDASSLPFIDLTGITVEVINWQCVFASSNACIASRNAWQARLLSFHAASVSIHDPQESQVIRPTY